MKVCGKLEELPQASRTFYFRDPEQPQKDIEETSLFDVATLSVVNRPVFSLVFRVVDACYNTTLTEASRSIRLRSFNTAVALECFFRIHLPYGYRVKLNIVTNFREQHVLRSGAKTVRRRRRSNSNEDSEEVDVDRDEVNGANYVYTSLEQTQQFEDDVSLLSDSEPVDAAEGERKRTRGGAQYRTSDTLKPISSDIHFNNLDNEQSNSRRRTGGDYLQLNEVVDPVDWTLNSEDHSDCGPSGLSVLLWDGDSVKWSQCYDKYSNSQRISLVSNSNIVGIKVLRQAATGSEGGSTPSDASASEQSRFPSLLIDYSAERIDGSQCAFGWIGFQQFCIAPVYDKGPLSWHDAETECQRLGGHLVSIRSREQQRLLDQFLRRR